MAQVEFTAVLMTLLRRHRLEAVPLKDEAETAVSQRLDGRLRDSVSVLTSQMEGIYDLKEGSEGGIALRLVRR